MSAMPDWDRIKQRGRGFGERVREETRSFGQGLKREWAEVRAGLSGGHPRLAAAGASAAAVDAPHHSRHSGPWYLRPVAWFGAFFTVLIVAIIILVSIWNWDWFRGPIARFASAKTERAVRIDGHLKVHLLTWSPRVDVSGVKVGNPKWAAGKGDMAQVGNLAVSLRLPQLLKGHIVLPLVAIQNADVRLIRDPSGQVNWKFGSGKANTDKPTKIPPIQNFIIQNGKLAYDDDAKRLHFTGTIDSQEQEGAKNTGFHLTGDGSLNKRPFVMRVTGGPLINIKPNQPYPFNADVRAGDTYLHADGAVPKPFNLGELWANTSVRGPDLADMYYLTGLALPNTPPYTIKGRLERKGTRFDYRNFVGRVGASDLEGNLWVQTKGGRPYLNVDARSRLLDFTDLSFLFGGAKAGGGKTLSPQQKALAQSLAAQHKLLPDSPLYVDRLRAMDADATYRATSVKDAPVPITSARLGVDLKRGVLDLNPIVFGFAQGQMVGNARIDGSSKLVKTDLDMRVRNLGLESFIPKVGGSAPLIGTLQARAKLHGVGDSVHKAASTADGNVTLVIPHGEIRQAFAELLGINASKGLIMLLDKNQHKTDLRCAVADFRVSNGVMNLQNGVIDTDVVRGRAKGTIDLGQEQMNLRIDGDTKKFRLVRLWAPITVKGPLNAPKPGVEAGGLVAQAGAAAALGVFLTPFAAILPFVDPGLGKDADCSALMSEASAKGAPPRGATTVTKSK